MLLLVIKSRLISFPTAVVGSIIEVSRQGFPFCGAFWSPPFAFVDVIHAEHTPWFTYTVWQFHWFSLTRCLRYAQALNLTQPTHNYAHSPDLSAITSLARFSAYFFLRQLDSRSFYLSGQSTVTSSGYFHHAHTTDFVEFGWGMGRWREGTRTWGKAGKIRHTLYC